MPQKSALNSSPSDLLVTSQKSSSCTPKCLTTLEAHNPLGHGSNQVHRSSTHMWHLWALPTSMHRLSEPSSLTFGVTYPILGNVSNDPSPNFNSYSKMCPNSSWISISHIRPSRVPSDNFKAICLRLSPPLAGARGINHLRNLGVMHFLINHSIIFYLR